MRSTLDMAFPLQKTTEEIGSEVLKNYVDMLTGKLTKEQRESVIAREKKKKEQEANLEGVATI